ncbi:MULTISPECIES: TolC family protein [Glaesserella]|uniref:Transporter n=1 Tax=Glaesserella australis TaxID=2094024 RepID=A0A328BV50_9PAST|nr:MULTISPECIES: TolC family protein [Glaesserella]AUI67070.1 transporter [Glaesserella sp. 15-184]RAL18188.1 transporter [Glaesserella australis]
MKISTTQRMLLFIFTGLLSTFSQASSLKTILQNNLSSAPEIKEAIANIEAAQNRVEQSKSQHYPIISATGSQVLSEYHRYQNDYQSRRLTPGLQMEVNLYSFGAIEKDIERSKKETEYYQHTYSATREELAYIISQLYLTALNIKESISVLEKSMKRHQDIIKNLKIIFEYDEGRESELVQAESRMLMVQQEINSYRQKLTSTLNTLSKYTNQKVTEKDLANPFDKLTEDRLYQQYTMQNAQENPLYKANMADYEEKTLSAEVEKRKQLPKLNLIGSATKEDRQIGMQLSWDIYNRSSSYGTREKASQISASKARLQRVIRDIEDGANIAKINIQESNLQLNALKKQMVSSAKVVEFYRLQFDIARRSLLDVLNAEKDLSSVELAYSSTSHNLRMSILDYLYSQGMISTWSNIKDQQNMLPNLK